MLPVLPPPLPPPVPLTTVLFDLDDTRFDHTGPARAALAATAAADPRLRAVDPEALCQRYSALLEEIHAQLLAGRCTYEQARQLRFARLLGPYGVGAAEAGAIAQQHYRRYQPLRRALPGALQLLEALQPHYRIGVVTNNRAAEQEEKLRHLGMRHLGMRHLGMRHLGMRHLGMRHLVDALITSKDVGVPKPDPRIFRAALARLGARPAEAVLVGDNRAADVVGAPRPLAHVPEITGLAPLPAVWHAITGRPLAAGAPAV